MPADAAPGWLLLDPLPAAGAAIRFETNDLHYLRRVCRARAGQRVTATDGRGQIARLRLEDREGALAGVVETLEPRERRRPCWVLCGSPEGERGDWLVEKLAELGVARLVPLSTERGEWEAVERRRARWERLTAAAVRQSMRAFRLQIGEPVPLERALRELPEGGSRWLADAAAGGGRNPASAAVPGIGAIGPSAGFSDAEWAHLTAQGFEPMSLADGRLRTETAALAWAAWWSSGGS